MIWVLLQSESPWQHNDSITFFSFIFVFLCTRGFFLRNRLKEAIMAGTAIIASIILQSLNKFSESVLGILRNEVLRIIKTVKQHAIHQPVPGSQIVGRRKRKRHARAQSQRLTGRICDWIFGCAPKNSCVIAPVRCKTQSTVRLTYF